MQTEQARFQDFILKKWKTASIEHLPNGDSFCYKIFTKKGTKYCMTARFTEHGDYCSGYLIDESGATIPFGKDFAIFIEYLKLELKSI